MSLDQIPHQPASAAFDLTGKTAIISGAGSVGEGIGIGRACAVVLASAGAHVALFDRDGAAAEETLKLVVANGGAGAVYEVDVTDDATVSGAVSDVVARTGSLDVLVNNVGIAGPRGTAVDVDLDAWDLGMAINVRSMVLLARHAIPHMEKNGGGSIVNIGSVAGMGGGYPSLFYPTSKGAIISLSQSMAAHHGRSGIRVNVVAPGQLFTPRIAVRNPTPEMRERRSEASMLGTEGTGWDAAYAVLYLASPAARWVTGVVLPVDAGISALLPLESPTSGKRTEH